jgi:hypothetical protein
LPGRLIDHVGPRHTTVAAALVELEIAGVAI